MDTKVIRPNGINIFDAFIVMGGNVCEFLQQHRRCPSSRQEVQLFSSRLQPIDNDINGDTNRPGAV
eukprot:scaffold757_cov168-Amphora_coffeaeformis.AAC.6